MRQNDISGMIVSTAIKIHMELGPGLMESVYERILCSELRALGLIVEKQKNYPVIWKGDPIDFGFKADLVVENKIIVEIKSIESLAPVHYKQLQTYLKISGLQVGLLMNFNEEKLKNGLRRVVNNFMPDT